MGGRQNLLDQPRKCDVLPVATKSPVIHITEDTEFSTDTEKIFAPRFRNLL